MSIETFTPNTIQFTENASRKVKNLIDEEGNERLKLRVFVTGGGCSGFEYGFTFDEDTAEDDTLIERNGVTLAIDPMSFQYLSGAEIDYEEGLQGSRFIVKTTRMPLQLVVVDNPFLLARKGFPPRSYGYLN